MADHGRVDILVNNAGLFAGIERRPFWEIDLDEWERVVGVNVRSVFLCSREVAGPMRAAGSGRIVNIASNVITFGMANLMHYVASKSAVVGMTRSMARELGPSGIAVNAVAPGLVTTEITEQTVPAEYRKLVADGQCLQVPILPQDIADAVAYLCTGRRPHDHGADAPRERRRHDGTGMKYAVSIKFMWGELPLPERARRAAAHGFDRIDLWDWRGEDIEGLAGGLP